MEHEKHDEHKHSSEQIMSEPEHKPTKKELEILQAQVYRQNRLLLSICLAILILALVGYFGVKYLQQNSTPTQWSYDNAMSDVLINGKMNANQYAYGGFVFARPDNNSLWTFQGKINGSVYEITTYYSPNELLDINLSQLSVAQIITKPIIIFALNSTQLDLVNGGPRAVIAAVELGKVLGSKNNIFNKIVRSTVTDAPANVTNETDSFHLTCANATTQVGIIQIGLGDKTQVIPKPHCIMIIGSDPQEIIRAADRVMFGLIQVMPLDTFEPTVPQLTQSAS